MIVVGRDLIVHVLRVTEAGLLHTAVNRKDHLTLQTHASIARGLRAAIAISVQRGNALTMQAGRSRALGRGSALAAAA